MRERDLFLDLLNLNSDEDRLRLLEEACCEDPTLRDRVLGLLKAHNSEDSFLEEPVVHAHAPGLGDTNFPTGNFGSLVTESSPVGFPFLSPSSNPEALGRLGHYEILECLGRGGFGIVFRALDTALQRIVAVKVLAPHWAVSSSARERFLREARSSAKVRHPHVVQVYAVEEQPLPFLVLEHIPGESLQQRLERTGPLKPSEVIRLGRQMAEGLAAAHASGLIHRDIKPGNILLEAGPSTQVKITDFGLARTTDDATNSQFGFVAGTPQFMSPEQANGNGLDQRTDLFSLGSVLYMMCTGNSPFRAETTYEVLKRVVEESPRPITDMVPEVPPDLVTLIARLHAKNPETRYSSIQEVVEILHRIQAPSSKKIALPAPSPGVTPDLPNKNRPFARVRLVGALMLFTLVLGLGLAEATQITQLGGVVFRFFSPHGTLVVEVEDPAVQVTIDGEDLVITGAGVREFRLKAGQHRLLAKKAGQPVQEELVTITSEGRKIVRVSQERRVQNKQPPARVFTTSEETKIWEQRTAALPPQEQFREVAKRLAWLNPTFHGALKPTWTDGVVTDLEIKTNDIADISPVRILKNLQSLTCQGINGQGSLTDLSPLSNLKLQRLDIQCNPLADLSPLVGMPLTSLNCRVSQVSDLSALSRLPLKTLDCGCSQVTDLSPLKGMRLTNLVVDHCKIYDLSPLEGMRLTQFHCGGSKGITDLSPLKGMPLTHLNCQNDQMMDLAPLTGMPLQELSCRIDWRRHKRVLHTLKSLKVINYQPAPVFWAEQGAGEGLDRKGKDS